MKRCPVTREQLIREFSRYNPWYKYEREKKHLNPKRLEVEARSIAKHLKV